MKKFLVRIYASVTMPSSDIWPDGDEPEDPSVHDVMKKIQDSSYGRKSHFIDIWNLESDLDVSVIDYESKEIERW